MPPFFCRITTPRHPFLLTVSFYSLGVCATWCSRRNKRWACVHLDTCFCKQMIVLSVFFWQFSLPLIYPIDGGIVRAGRPSSTAAQSTHTGICFHTFTRKICSTERVPALKSSKIITRMHVCNNKRTNLNVSPDNNNAWLYLHCLKCSFNI